MGKKKQQSPFAGLWQGPRYDARRPHGPIRNRLIR
jgi:hypothetical protein